MSYVDHANAEMKRIGFANAGAMAHIVERFVDTWGAGLGAVEGRRVLAALIAGKLLSPLTGDDDEWEDIGDGAYRNRRLPTVHKDPRFHEGKQAYDTADPVNPTGAITFPYWPDWAR